MIYPTPKRPHLSCEIREPGTTMYVIAECPRCRSTQDFTLVAAYFKEWYTGLELIQNVFPNLTTHERERLMTGYCQACWDWMFPPEEE